jgi:hypothetical protein
MFEKNHIDDSASNIVRQLLERSVLFRLLSFVTNPVIESSSKSRSVQFAHRIRATVADNVIRSYIYRWLTTEPDPEVIVIDLRETWTVGPVLWSLTVAAGLIYPYWRNSTCQRVGGIFRSIENYFIYSRVVTVLAKVLPPPQKPEPNTEENSEKE